MAGGEAVPGTVAWADLTVPDADAVREFYEAVVGWRSEPVAMGGYSDFNMVGPAGDEPRAGICHARGANAGLPPVWLLYVVVEDLDAALAECRSRGGEVLREPSGEGAGPSFAVIGDPAGAALALYRPGSPDRR